jgi:hypothetical protein
VATTLVETYSAREPTLLDAEQLLQRLRSAREQYERVVVRRNESSKFWRGLVNRWDKSLVTARKFGAGQAESAQENSTRPILSMHTGWIGALVAALLSWSSKARTIGAPEAASARPAVTRAASEPTEAGPPWLAKATGYLGFEEEGQNRGIEDFIAQAHCGSVGDPWCAIFVNACLEAWVCAARSPRWRAVSSTTRISCSCQAPRSARS